jgi:hypothetical protein
MDDKDIKCEELDDLTVSAFGVRSRKLSNIRKGRLSDSWPKFIMSSF